MDFEEEQVCEMCGKEITQCDCDMNGPLCNDVH